MKKPVIGILGSGNMAFCLGQGLLEAGYLIKEIHSTNVKEGKILAKRLSSKYFSNIDKIEGKADLYLFCLPDDAIEIVSKQFPFKNKLCVHTSGSVPLNILMKQFQNCGVFYPVQSLNKNILTDWNSIPICIEGSNDETEKSLNSIGKSISKKVVKLNSDQRKTLHLSAVFANNFSNACYQISADILSNANISFELLRPLILSTAQKIQNNKPESVQTGPAIRKDEKVIKLQEFLLKNKKEFLKIYKLFTKYIQRKN